MKNILLIAALFFSSVNELAAQYHFHSRNYVGILEGEKGSSFQLQSINGLQRKTWFAGIGAGLDYYRFRTIPLFLSVNKDFRSAPRSFFASLYGGINFLWDDNTSGFENQFRKGNFTPSLYLAGGLGYKLAIHKDALLLNIGYSLKHLEETQEASNPCFNPPCPVIKDRVHYRFNRLSLKVGWQF